MNIGMYGYSRPNPLGVIPSGTAMLFVQTAAPVGWTKSVTYNDRALRVVSGTAGSGGAVAFSAALGDKVPTGTVSGTVSGTVTVDNTTLTETQMPAHTHNTQASTTVSYTDGTGGWQTVYPASYASSSTGGGAAHTHTSSLSASMSATFSGATIALNPTYVDAIIATKD